MEETGGFTYEEWCKRRECVAVPTETIAPKSSISNRSNNTRHSEVSDQENAYRYVPMREPGPQDAVVSFFDKRSLAQKNLPSSHQPIAYALYPQPGYTYMYPPQQLQAMAAPPPPGPAPAVVAPSAHSKKEEAHYHHYTHERVRERSIRPIPEPPTIEKVASPKVAPLPAVPQVTMAGMTYGAYPFGFPGTAVPVAYAMPNYPVPMNSETASTVTPKATKDRVWVGRTKKQVDEDNAKIAHKEGVYKPNEMVPKGASSDQLFWVIEPDNTNTLRNFRTIEDDLQPGKWKIDPRYGNAYFVRDKPEKS
ncbi:hypothetical protein D6D23_09333 [Aureobasidium pullulans]|nr:hypothetical protein D6D27_08003 [Aureobasidium pullulans]THW14564.1 hypothetical protein D6D23_09333 [Aureobasidium pullulans]